MKSCAGSSSYFQSSGLSEVDQSYLKEGSLDFCRIKSGNVLKGTLLRVKEKITGVFIKYTAYCRNPLIFLYFNRRFSCVSVLSFLNVGRKNVNLGCEVDEMMSFHL